MLLESFSTERKMTTKKTKTKIDTYREREREREESHKKINK